MNEVGIDDVELDPTSRDDIPAILLGIQLIHRDRALLDKILALLKSHLLLDSTAQGDGPQAASNRGKINPAVGRPGMSLWSILVLALLKQGLNCDYDRLHELACEHGSLRRIMGLSDVFHRHSLSQRTLVRNLSLLTPALLGEINQLVVEAGHDLVGHPPEEPLSARCDSFVVETNVEYPTDMSMSWDALRWVLTIMGAAFGAFGLAGWRKHGYLLEKGRRLHKLVRTARQYKKRPRRVKQYLKFGREIAQRVLASVEDLRAAGVSEEKIAKTQEMAGLLVKLLDQVERRILKGETIPASEKIYSVFVPFTRWIVKGKAGVAMELGVPVCVVEDQYQFVLDLW